MQDRELELIADNELQRKKIAELEIEVQETRSTILGLMKPLKLTRYCLNEYQNC